MWTLERLNLPFQFDDTDTVQSKNCGLLRLNCRELHDVVAHENGTITIYLSFYPVAIAVVPSELFDETFRSLAIVV